MNRVEPPQIPAARIEIASVEHPRLLAALIDEAAARNVPIARVSQGSGVRMLTDGELEEMLTLAHANGIELFLFVSERNSFEPLSDSLAGEQLRGEVAFRHALEEVERCASLGVDGVLIADVGLLAVAGRRRKHGDLGNLQLKTSAAIAPLNAAAAALYERLGATSINVASFSALDDLVAIRAALGAETTIDVYVESPDVLHGGLRYRDLPDFVSRLAPVTLKFGLRNAASLYPYGGHLEPFAEQTIREKVRRSALALEELDRTGIKLADPFPTGGADGRPR